jgi:hypothetical protein
MSLHTSETHCVGLPVIITVDEDGKVTIEVDLGEATVGKTYEDSENEVTERFLDAVAQSIQDGTYEYGD